ncbi:MAG: DUF1990 domain-containing protein [Planctomycetia bacterium]|nr:DUF1990 domain-containing protein [Planctomycetia bacterium]
MFTFRRPTDAALRRFVDTQVGLDFTYTDVGATATVVLHAGYNVDRTRRNIGLGDHDYRSAIQALRAWRHFELGWLSVWQPDLPIETGRIAVVVARALGLWSAHTARIVYVIDEPHRFGFAYGTLPGHAEQGEERFLVEQLADGSVWYDVVAFSRPRHLLAKLAYPFIRRLQKRFGRETADAMVRAVRSRADRSENEA